MKELIQWLQQPENIAILSAIFLTFATVLRGLGELFIAIGNSILITTSGIVLVVLYPILP